MLCLRQFLELKHKKCCDEVYYSKWSKNMDYQKWMVCKLIGKGAFAKVYLVKHLIDDGNITRYYAMKCIKKSMVMDKCFTQSTKNER
jgi:serine/threonine protein kinase